jgi:septal ring factor EnvC (AmiA/AmiB activator)
MKSSPEDNDKAAPSVGLVAAAVLRAIDACLRALHRLRRRFEAPLDKEASPRDARGGSASGENSAAETAEDVPRQKPLLYRLLIIVICLLLGGITATLLAYRGFAKVIEARGTVIERLQEDVELSKKEETRSVNLTAKFQKENSEYRLQMRELQREADEYKTRIEDLNKQLTALKRVEPPAPTARASAPVARAIARPNPAPSPAASPPPKTGTCAVGTGNLSGNLAECIDKFNRR